MGPSIAPVGCSAILPRVARSQSPGSSNDNVLPALAFTSIVNCEGALASRGSVCLVFRNCVLHSFSRYSHPETDATLLMRSLDFKRLMFGLTNGLTLIQEGQAQILGDTQTLLEPPSYLIHFSADFR